MHSFSNLDYDVSFLNDRALPRKLLGAYYNADRISGSDYAKKNFGKISISGEKDNRIAKIEVFSKGGKLKRTLTIPANELQRK